MKLDLINSRSDPPQSVRVFDSLEDSPTRTRREGRSLVRMAPVHVDIRTGNSKRLATFVNDRFDQSIVDQKGDRVFIQDRHRRKLPVINFSPSKPSSDTQSLSSSFMDEANNTEDFKIESSFHCYALDMIKDKVHDSLDYTVAARVASGKLPGAWGKATRKIMSEDQPSDIGPGSYRVTNVNLATIPAVSISLAGRTPSDVREDLLPLEKRLRLERMRANAPSPERSRSRSPSLRVGRSLERSLSPGSRESSTSPAKPLTTAKAYSTKGTISAAPRFSGPFYRTESYTKTSGMLLGPDFDTGFDKRIPFDMSKSQLASRSRSPSPGADVDLDLDRFFSISGSLSSSSVRYASAFQSKAAVGLKIPPPTTSPEIGPGSYPNAFHPSVEVRDPHKLSLCFQGGDKGLDVKAAAPDGYEAVKSFAEQHRRGPRFTLAADPNRKNHLAAVAERKMSQIYPRLISKHQGLGSLIASGGDEGSVLSGAATSLSSSSSRVGSPGQLGPVGAGVVGSRSSRETKHAAPSMILTDLRT